MHYLSRENHGTSVVLIVTQIKKEIISYTLICVPLISMVYLYFCGYSAWDFNRVKSLIVMFSPQLYNVLEFKRSTEIYKNIAAHFFQIHNVDSTCEFPELWKIPMLETS